MEEGQVAGTQAKICHIRIEDGIIAEIRPEDAEMQSNLPKYDCNAATDAA